MLNSYCIGQCRYRIFLAFQKVPLDTAGQEAGLLHLLALSPWITSQGHFLKSGLSRAGGGALRDKAKLSRPSHLSGEGLWCWGRRQPPSHAVTPPRVLPGGRPLPTVSCRAPGAAPGAGGVYKGCWRGSLVAGSCERLGPEDGELVEAAVTAPGRAQRRATRALRRAACAPLLSGVRQTWGGGGCTPLPLRLTVLVNLVVNY